MGTWCVLLIGAVALLLLPGCDTARVGLRPGPEDSRHRPGRHPHRGIAEGLWDDTAHSPSDVR